MIKIELSPVDAEKVLEYIDGKVRQGGVDSAVELAPLAVKLKEGLADFRAEPDDPFASDADLSLTGSDIANSNGSNVIDATNDEVDPFA